MTPINVADDVHSFPGRFEGLRQDGSSGLILSYGTVEFAPLGGRPAGAALAPGRSATIEIPLRRQTRRRQPDQGLGHNAAVVARRDDRRLGRGRQRLVVASATSPSGFALARRGDSLQLVELRQVSLPPFDRRTTEAEMPGRQQRRRCARGPDRHRLLLERRHGPGAAGPGPWRRQRRQAACRRRRPRVARPRIPAWAAEARGFRQKVEW